MVIGTQRLAARSLSIWLALLVLATVGATGGWAQELNREIHGVIAKAKLGTARVGISVIDVSTQVPLAQVVTGGRAADADKGFIPASNMKLLTAGAALMVLGPDFEFRTRIYRSGSRLVVEGSGDPGFADPVLLEAMKAGVDDFIGRLCAAVAENGPKAPWITEVVIDDRVFDREYTHPTWPSDQRDNWYCAPVGGLNFHANVLWVYARPGARQDEPPAVRSEPSAPWIELVNRARTVRNDTTTIGVGREGDSTRFIVRGAIRAALDRPMQVTIHQSSLVFGRLLADRLTGAGLGAGPRPLEARLASMEEELSADGVLAIVRTPISTVLSRCNGDSHNLYAEALIKRIGHAVTAQPGSWANGGAVVRMQVRDKLGAEAAAAVSIADGSGLSRANRVTPELLSRWLVAMDRDDRIGAAFMDSLSRPGEGLLERRFRRVNLRSEVRAKSGYVSGVRSLSGYVVNSDSGRRVAFSILVNEVPATVSGARVKEFHEEVVAVIDKWLADHSPLVREAIGG